MLRFLLAAVAAFAVFAAQPAFACDDCKNCPMNQKTAQAEKKDVKAGCPCAGEAKEACKCAANCQCAHCGGKKAPEKAGEEKKS